METKEIKVRTILKELNSGHNEYFELDLKEFKDCIKEDSKLMHYINEIEKRLPNIPKGFKESDHKGSYVHIPYCNSGFISTL